MHISYITCLSDRSVNRPHHRIAEKKAKKCTGADRQRSCRWLQRRANDITYLLACLVHPEKRISWNEERGLEELGIFLEKLL
jgi:hypothetical protein